MMDRGSTSPKQGHPGVKLAPLEGPPLDPDGSESIKCSREATFLELHRSRTKTHLMSTRRSNSKIPLTLTTSRFYLPKLDDHDEDLSPTGDKISESDENVENTDSNDDNNNNNEILALAREVTKQFTFADYSISRDVTKAPIFPMIPTEKKLYAKCYEEACRRLRIPPVSVITRSLSDPLLELRRYCLGEKGVRSLAVALVNNRHVMSLDLTDNWMQPQGARWIADMLKANSYMTHLNLSENGIGSSGAEAICGAVSTSSTINRLNLSHNGLRDTDSKSIRSMLLVNKSLRSLDVSHNEFREVGGIIIGNALKCNSTLIELRLAWNHLRGKGSVGLCLGLSENYGLRTLDVAWNGFGVEGAKSLAKMLRVNRTLKDLDVTCNRLNTDAIKHFLKGLMKNESLLSLKLARNSFPTKVATAVLTSIVESPNLPLTELDMHDVVVDEEFVSLLNEACRSYRPLRVVHGPVMRVNKGAKKGEGNPMSTNPLGVFFEHMNKKGLRIQDLYKRYDTGNREKFVITPQQFKDGIMSIQIPLNGGAMEQIIEKIKNRRGNPDLVKLMEEEKKYRKKHLKDRMMKSQQRTLKHNFNDS